MGKKGDAEAPEKAKAPAKKSSNQRGDAAEPPARKAKPPGGPQTQSAPSLHAPAPPAEVEEKKGPSWEDMESKKLRIAEIMDRVEFLTKAQNIMTEVTASQTYHVKRAIFHQSRAQLLRVLDGEVPAVERVFAYEGEKRQKSRTVLNRLRALDKYIASQEFRRVGPRGALAAEESARGNTGRGELAAWLPTYSELIDGGNRTATGDFRMPPVTCCTTIRPYVPPIAALRHGRRAPGLSQSMGNLSASAPASTLPSPAPNRAPPEPNKAATMPSMKDMAKEIGRQVKPPAKDAPKEKGGKAKKQRPKGGINTDLSNG